MPGIPDEKIYDERLYRALDKLLPHKEDLEKHLKNRLGTLFNLDYDLLLYDVTSTYFEGVCEGNPQAQRGYSRDKRGDCKQVCIGPVVTKDGIPLGYEVFAGNRNDVEMWQEIVTTMEKRYGRANRIWCGDRGMMSKANIEFMESGNRRYIIGESKGTLKKFESQLLDEDWRVIREGLEVKMCPSPDGGKETYILCRSRDRREKEKAMHERFERRIDEALEKVRASCEKRNWKKEVIDRRISKIMAKNSRAAGLGDEPRRIFDELGKISLVDVVLPTRQKNIEIRRRCIARPTDHQTILLDRLGLSLPRQLRVETKM